MLLRDKMFVVSSSLDETVKSQISLYDITLFRSLTEFEKFVNTTPVVIDTLVFTTNEVAFTASNMQRVQAILSSPFIKLTGSVLYLVSENYNIKVINEYLTDKDLNNWVVYQGDLTVKYVMNMISGEGRDSTEAQLEVVTYRQRASEYVREHNLSESFSDDIHYTTDDEELAELPKEEEPELLNPTALNQTEVDYMVGDSFECTLFSFLVAQYRALTGKTVIVERDWEYHTLTDMVTKSGISHHMVFVEDMERDVEATLNAIKVSKEKLIVIGSKRRKYYDYGFLMDIVESNLNGFVSYIIRECNYGETPYKQYYTIIAANTVPDLLKCCNSLKHNVDTNKVVFIGLQRGSLGSMNISTGEMQGIIATVLGKNGVPAQVVKVDGIRLKGEDTIYDVFSILNRGNKKEI